MMHTAKTPVSEVLRNAEAQISRANDTRRRASELYAQAARLQEEAYADAIAELGEEDGASTYRLACRSVGADPGDRTGAIPSSVSATDAVSEASVIVPDVVIPAPQISNPVPVVQASAVNDPYVPAEAPPEAVVVPPRQPVEHTPSAPAVPLPQEDPSRLERYGVLIKRSKLAEAEEVIGQAIRTVSQNRKTNPYADDRGRNAWRNTLFAAVLAQSGGAQSTPNDPTRQSVPLPAKPASERGPETIEVSASAVYAEVETLAVSPQQNADSASDDPDDDVLDDELPTRSVPFTRNPAQADIRETSKEPPPFTRQPPPFIKPAAEPSAAKSAPEVHVSRPILNRPVGFGQSVPAPPGLRDTISRLNAGQQDQGSAPVTTPRPPASRPAPPFIRSK